LPEKLKQQQAPLSPTDRSGHHQRYGKTDTKPARTSTSGVGEFMAWAWLENGTTPCLCLWEMYTTQKDMTSSYYNSTFLLLKYIPN
jgi:hypothetical protein